MGKQFIRLLPLLDPATAVVVMHRTALLSLQNANYARRWDIPVLGCLLATVSKGDASCSATFFIVESGTALLVMDHLNGLQLHLEGNCILPPAAAELILLLDCCPLRLLAHLLT